MANVRKRISELPALTPATMDTTFVVGISGSTTYRISINQLTSSLDGQFASDLVTNALSGTLDGKLSTSSFQSYTASISTASLVTSITNLNNTTSSYELKGRGILSGSISYTSLTNVPQGIVSQSTDLGQLNSFTSSYYTDSASFSSRIDAATNEQSFAGLISGSSQFTASYDERYVLSGSITQTTWDNIANKPNDIVSSSTQISDLGYVTGSYAYLTEFNSLTQSFNIISGSVVNITNAVDVTQLNNTTASLNNYTASLKNAINVSGIGTSSVTTIYGNLHIEGTTTTTSASNLTIQNNFIYLNDESFVTNPDLGIAGNYNDGTYAHSGIFSDASDNHTWKVFKGYTLEPSQSIDTNDASFQLADFKANKIYGEIIATNDIISSSAQITAFGYVSGSYETTGRGIISSSANLVTTSSFNSYTASISTASLVTSISNLNSATSSYLTSLSGAISSSSQLTSSYDTRYVISGSVGATPLGTISGSAQITSLGFVSGSYLTSLSGAISSSSQLTSSFDARYTLSGSVVSGTTPAGTISGSSQLTSSFDGRYTQTGSFNTLTASFNSFTASAQSVTTGSNSFNGTQTITGSLIITTGSFVASQILANTASLYLTSGSNMYVQNNGVVEITGSLIVSGSTMFASAGGDEGGEIQFGIPTTNTTLQNRVTVDVWRNRLRIFEGSAGANGVYIDLSKPTGNNNEITYKASGLVNAGDFVTLDNIKATITTSGQRGLSLATISGTFVCNIAGNYAGAVVGASGSSGTATITTSASTSLFGWGFTTQGDIATYIITDTTNSRAYRITIQIGGSYLNNLVSIERLH